MNYELSDKAIEVNDDLIEAIRQPFWKIFGEYAFDMHKYRIASQENRLKPVAMPILWDHLLFKKKIMSVKVLANTLKRHKDFSIGVVDGHDQDTVLEARCYMLRTGFLREVHLLIRLNDYDKKGKLYKDIEADIGKGGIDVIYCNSKSKNWFYLAVKKESRRKDKHSYSQEKRKGSKKYDNVTEFFVKNNPHNPNGLDLVSNEEIEKIACH